MDSFQRPYETASAPHGGSYQFHQIQPPRQPASPNGPLYSSQFQHHPSQTPLPPPQWAPPRPPHHRSDYVPPTASYPSLHSYHHNQFPPPPPPPRSHVPPHTHIPQPYPQMVAAKNEEHWAARDRAWADAKSAMESQQLQSLFAPTGRLQEQSHYHDQYQQTVDSCYPDVQNQSHPSSSYQQFPILNASIQKVPGFSQEAAVSVETSYASNGHLPCSTRDIITTEDPTVAVQHQGNLPTNPSVNQQEVPSSCISVTVKETADQSQQSYTLMSLSSSLTEEQQHHVQLSMQVPFASGSHSVDPAIHIADQPLDFAPRFNRDSHPQVQLTYAHHDSVTTVRGN